MTFMICSQLTPCREVRITITSVVLGVGTPAGVDAILNLLSFSALIFCRRSVHVFPAQQEVECDYVGHHQQGYIDNRNRIGGAQLPRDRRKAVLSGVVVINDEIGYPHEIENDDKRPEQRTDPCGQKRQHGEHSGCEVTVGGEGSELCRQTCAYDARKDKDEPEESKAV